MEKNQIFIKTGTKYKKMTRELLEESNLAEVIGDKNKKINRLGIGTGACTDVFQMSEHGVDACLVSDDGINNWTAVQWAMDNDLPLIVINHMTCEAPGIECLAKYLNEQLQEVSFTYVPNKYGIYHIEK